jgi:CRP/FNR family transcriptional regulator
MIDKRPPLFDCNNCLFRTLSCQYFSSDEFELIRRTSTQLHFVKGETILRQETKSSHLVFLHKGIVKFNYQNEQGKNFIMTIVKGPKLLGGANLFFKDTNIFSIVAMEDCDLCLIDGRALRNVMMKHGNYMMSLFERSVEMFQASIFNFISLAHKQVNGRIADVLIYLHANVYNNGDYDMTLTRKELAEFAACSHENVITTLSKMNKEGIVRLDGKKIEIVDLPKLHEISKRG